LSLYCYWGIDDSRAQDWGAALPARHASAEEGAQCGQAGSNGGGACFGARRDGGGGGLGGRHQGEECSANPRIPGLPAYGPVLGNLCEQVTARILARIERYWSFESFSINPDPRLIAGMYGDVVASSEGGGVAGVASSATSWSWTAGRAATALTELPTPPTAGSTGWAWANRPDSATSSATFCADSHARPRVPSGALLSL